jgi:hypothetical protein
MRANRSSEINGNLPKGIHFQVRKKICQTLICRPVDDESVSTFFAIVGRQKQHCAPKIRVAQIWMRNKKLAGQIGNITAERAHE